MIIQQQHEPTVVEGAVVNLRCPICRHEGAFHRYQGVNDPRWLKPVGVVNGKQQHESMAAGIRKCPNAACNSLIFVLMKDQKVIESFPPQVIDFDATNLPPKILSSFEEAVKCHSAGCYKASALMVRRVLEELCDDKTATGKTLKARLTSLSSTVVLPQDLLNAADELRLLGNEPAHVEAKDYDDIGSEEVEIAIELAKELLKAVYQYTSLVARLQALKNRTT